MPRGTGQAVSNKFTRGLITEATGMNFPEDGVTDALNVKFDPIGFVERRLGIDLEGSADALEYSKTDGCIKEFLWQAVANSGQYTFLVLQVGTAVHFYKVAVEGTVSANISPHAIDLNDYKAPSQTVLNVTPCSFSSGQGYLFIAHPNCDPVIVRWKPDVETFEAARITVLIRDFEGLVDNLKVDEQPSTLSIEHHYNLLNQGWDDKVRVGSVTNELGSDSTGSQPSTPSLTWETIS